ncbi:uncharacterized protein BDR25DRAFT_263051 [Lindgomyces ingoldianus]|uniref:Uncharacterized protein n=1 Tax=Lindgomyces ingoldianus TaxID=673940 RepID=A0ACB6QRW0_9PLEO|nr:uncharacterized protein BDR25DRAFT_263051 [Lindgomyces ingoldianus]KAF2469723.1 hypothetical protein BDR25DRAFT_263051 [Lindgomyces ingoldianus]
MPTMRLTSLQGQLAEIAAKSTRQLDLKAQKAAHAKSLLFEPKVAASQSFDAVYLVCYEGFRDLCALDHRFTPFARTLFSEQSKVEDRTQMTKAENQELDSVLEAFIALVGPRLLLKPAEKALEWLVRRFRVHEHNTQCLVLTYLPYHNTPQFLSLLSILPSSPPPALRFLFSYITPPKNPPRQTIVYTAAHTPAFFNALQNHVVKVLQAGYQNPPLLSFWSGITTQAIDATLESSLSGRKGVQDQRMDEILLRILPVLNECLKSSTAQEAVLGSYMIIIILATKGAFEDKVLDSLMEAVVLSQEEETMESSLMCLAIVAEERSQAHLPASVVKRVLKTPDLYRKLQSLADKCRVGRLTLGCALGALHRLSYATNSTEFQLFFQNAMDPHLLDDSQVEISLSSLLRLLRKIVPGSTQHRELLDLIAKLTESSPVSAKLQTMLHARKAVFESLGVVLSPLVDTSETSDDNTDEDMADAERAPAHINSQTQISLPDISESSFLDTVPPKSLDEATSAFEQAVIQGDQLSHFLSRPALRRDEGFQGTLFPSFMIRLWCGPNSNRVRLAALRATTSLVEEVDSTVDFQVLIPYLLYALSDPSSDVRRAAATCTVTLAENTKAMTDWPGIHIWGSSDLYGANTSKVCLLAPEQTAKFFASVLVPILEECAMDSEYAITSIRTLLQGTQISKDKSAKGLKSTERSLYLAFLSSHVAVTPLLRLRLRILPLFESSENSFVNIRFNTLFPLVRNWCSLTSSDTRITCNLEKLDVSDVDRAHLNVLVPRDSESASLLRNILQGKFNEGRMDLQGAAFDRLNTIWLSLRSEDRLSLAQCLLDLALKEKHTNKLDEVRKERSLETLRDIELGTNILTAFIESVPATTRMPEGPPATKRRKTSRSEMARVELQSPHETAVVLRRLTLVLELVQGSNPSNHPALFKSLFAILGELQQLKQQSGSNLAYLQSLVLDSLSPIVDKLKNKDPAEYRSSVRADLLIDCIRHSTNHQVQNAALLLIGSLASWVPELVLHNLMPIFTFIGSSLVRQDDGYSAHVVDQTISQVVPQLAASLKTKSRDFLTGVADLLLSFTAAFEHIPQPRRLKLFSELARTLGPEDSLYAIIALLVDRYPSGTSGRKLITQLLKQFDPMATLQTFKGYLALVIEAASPKPKISNTLFGLNEKKPSQVEDALTNLISSLADLAVDGALRSHIVQAFVKRADSAEARSVFAEILEATIQLSKKVVGKPGLYQSCSRVLANCLDLLPTLDLIKSAELLLRNADHQVQIAAIKSVEVRAGKVSQNEQTSVSAILSFLPAIRVVLQKSQDIDVKITSVSCTDRIVERFGKKDPPAVAAIAQTIASPHSLASGDDRLRILSLLCLASIVPVVEGDEAISLLPIVLPKAFQYLEESIDRKNDGLHNAVFALLSDIVEHLAFMFSGEYMSRALELSHRSALSQLSEACDQDRLQFYRTIARCVGAKEIFTSLGTTLPHALGEGYKAFHEHLELLLLAIENHDKSTVIRASPALFSLLLRAFDLRQAINQIHNEDAYSEGTLDRLEDSLVEAVISMTLKLNDATFRPFFVQLVKWADPLSIERISHGIARSVTFFKFMTAFFDRFKSIVTSYASYIVKPASLLLEHLVTYGDEHGLRQPLLGALQKSFQYDQDGFWQAPSHYGTILHPLLKQLTISATAEITNDIIPAITELATASSSFSNHREINAILLKYMRAEETQTRLATVMCEQSLTKRLGEEWLGLLPEMLPFISELREDDDEIVERETQRWILMVEEVLGEGLEDMLQ